MIPAASQTSHRTSGPDFTVSLGLAIITLALFWPVMRFGFVEYDDPDFVLNNSRIQAGLQLQSIVWAFQSLHIYWQPFTWISYMLDYALYGLKGAGYHTTNLLLHICNTVLLFGLLRRLTGNLGCCVAAAALFAWHPLHVETVAWIAERKGVLSTTFWLLTLRLYLRHTENPSWQRMIPVALMMSCGLMAKSMLVTLPFTLLLLDVWPLRRFAFARSHGSTGQGRVQNAQALWMEKIPLFALAAVSSVLTIVAQKQFGALLETASFSSRLAHAAVSYVQYLRKTIWPSDLAVFYPHPGVWPAGLVTVSCLILAGITIAAVVAFRRAPYLSFGWAWFLGTLLPVIGLIQAGDQSMADRYTYVPLIGIFIAATFGTAAVITHWNIPSMVGTVTAGIVLGGCALATRAQLQSWSGTRPLFEHALAVTANNYLAHSVLGMLDSRDGRDLLAEEHFQKALAIVPTFAEAHFHYSQLLAKQGKNSEAIELLRAAVHSKPRFAEAQVSLGAMLANAGRLEEAAGALQQAVLYSPNLAEAHANLGIVMQRQGQLAEALRAFSTALQLKPGSTEIRRNCASALHASGRYAAAKEQYELLAKQMPNDLDLMLNLASIQSVLGQPAEAAQLFEKVIQLKPDWADPLNKLAWLRSTCPNSSLRDGAAAVKLAERACELTNHQEPLMLNTLAAAYAEAGSYPLAVATAQKALAQAEASKNAPLSEMIQLLLKQFTQGTPFRTP